MCWGKSRNSFHQAVPRVAAASQVLFSAPCLQQQLLLSLLPHHATPLLAGAWGSRSWNWKQGSQNSTWPDGGHWWERGMGCPGASGWNSAPRKCSGGSSAACAAHPSAGFQDLTPRHPPLHTRCTCPTPLHPGRQGHEISVLPTPSRSIPEQCSHLPTAP